ncbi:hypothetical protein L0B53_04380 [Vibrio sp. SS-MA-C1-2]|uniref:hypothetical protein n=1 Tax=Vibrio sp. SS-MA-C1-2 TaxID=2908646 RepID=UPI001F231892|nr:hypothetical protein [Vibrio sp. SS-MA-C1-2]UJF17158.1 hypothetical protein L0B53_04380 [Vibrio sp. SS-MA-C1-2]
METKLFLSILPLSIGSFLYTEPSLLGETSIIINTVLIFVSMVVLSSYIWMRGQFYSIVIGSLILAKLSYISILLVLNTGIVATLATQSLIALNLLIFIVASIEKVNFYKKGKLAFCYK